MLNPPPPRRNFLVSPARAAREGARDGNSLDPGGEKPWRLAPPFPASTLGRIARLHADRMVPAALETVEKLHGGWGCAVFLVEDAVALAPSLAPDDGGGTVPFVLAPETLSPAPLLREHFSQAAEELLARACLPVAERAAAAREALAAASELAGQPCLVLALPLFEGERLDGVLCFVDKDAAGAAEARALGALQAAGTLRLLSASRAETDRIRSRFGKVAAFVELLASSEGGVDFAECARRLANHLRETLGCDLVALSTRSWRGHRLAAVSGETGPAEAHSPGRRALLACLAEAIHRRQPLLSRRRGAAAAAGETGADSLREWFDPALSLCLPLIDAQGAIRGGWLFLWSDEPADFEEKRSLIQAASPEVAPLLSLLRRAKPGPALGAFLRLWRRGSLTQRRAGALLAAAALAAALVPLPYPVRATCELQPMARRVIAAPFDGILQRSVARAGEVVAEGQLLAELDGRELRSQLSDAIARRERALKESDATLAEGRVAEARMAALEAESLSHQIELLEYRQRHLQVRSPIAGLVLQGDLERSEGAPVRAGDALFEVGPLERLVAEVAVLARDVSLVQPGAKVTLKLESQIHATAGSVILRVAPRSEWIADQNVFLCEAEIENPGGHLRAGVKGKAKVEGPRRPLLWIWGRDAWLALRYHLW